MAEAFAHNFRVHAIFQHQSSVDVSHVVEAYVGNPGNPGQLREFFAHGIWKERSSIRVAEHVIRLTPSDPKPLALLQGLGLKSRQNC